MKNIIFIEKKLLRKKIVILGKFLLEFLFLYFLKFFIYLLLFIKIYYLSFIVFE